MTILKKCLILHSKKILLLLKTKNLKNYVNEKNLV